VVGDLALDNRGVLRHHRAVLEHRLIGRDHDGVGLLEIHPKQIGSEHTVHAGHLLDDRVEDAAQRPAEIHRRAHHGVEHILERPRDLRAIAG
jgi:hypothetical protein